jgi:hypothetical protein
VSSSTIVSSIGDAVGATTNTRRDLDACFGIGGVYDFRFLAPHEHLRAEYIGVRDAFFDTQRAIPLIQDRGDRAAAIERLRQLKADLGRFELLEWDRDVGHNLVVNQGLNNLLDNQLSASSYTAAWYMGLIDSSGWSEIAAGDTAASHSGWTESTAYSQSNRPTTAWSAASSQSKSLSSALTFSINATATIKGGFLISNATKGGTSGTLFSARLFTGGDKSVANGDTLSVSYTASATSS